MTDYLEQGAEETALWEAIRRSLDPVAPEEFGEQKRQTGEQALESDQSRLPLLDGVLTLERKTQTARASALREGREGNPAQRLTEAPDRQGEALSWPVNSTGVGFGEDAMSRAEQLDRVFRRDSRRYDGGFFLY